MLGAIHHIVSKPVVYLHDKLTPRQFFIISSILVGLTSGAAAIMLKYFVHSIISFVRHYATYWDGFVLFALFPFVGILLTIATGPLLFPRLWHHHYGKLAFVWSALTKASLP